MKKRFTVIGIFFSLLGFGQAIAQGTADTSAQEFKAERSGIKSVPLKGELDLMKVESNYMPVLIHTGIYEEEGGPRVSKPSVNPYPDKYVDNGNMAKYKKVAETPSIFKSYNGFGDGQYTPPDNSIAVSKKGFVISAMNCNYRIFKPDGSMAKYSSFYDLFKTQYPDLNAPLFDPRVIYDPENDRFIVVTLYEHTSDKSKIMIMFSKSGDPTEGWYLYSLPGDVLGKSQWTDYPNIGLSDKELFVSGNLFTDDQNYAEPVILQIDKYAGYQGKDLQYQTWSKIVDANGGNAFTVVPVNYGVNGNYGSKMYFVSNLLNGGNKMQLYKLSGPMTDASANLSRQVYTVPFSYYSPYTATQKGSGADYLNAGDCRIKQAFFLNDVIHYVFALQNNNGFSAIAYCRLNVATTLFDYRIIGQNQYYFSYPSVASMSPDDKGQQAMIVYERSGAGVYPEVCIMYADEDMNFSNPVTVQAGTAAVNFTNEHIERWGDYSTICRNFYSTSCMLAGCYGSGGKWSTRIAEVGLEIYGSDIAPVTNEVEEPSVYPNPSTDYFNLSFKLRKDAQLSIDLYDMQGRNVATLYKAYTHKGQNEFSFNQASLPSGIYFLRMTADGKEILNRKLVRN